MQIQIYQGQLRRRQPPCWHQFVWHEFLHLVAQPWQQGLAAPHLIQEKGIACPEQVCQHLHVHVGILGEHYITCAIFS